MAVIFYLPCGYVFAAPGQSWSLPTPQPHPASESGLDLTLVLNCRQKHRPQQISHAFSHSLETLLPPREQAWANLLGGERQVAQTPPSGQPGNAQDQSPWLTCSRLQAQEKAMETGVEQMMGVLHETLECFVTQPKLADTLHNSSWFSGSVQMSEGILLMP